MRFCVVYFSLVLFLDILSSRELTRSLGGASCGDAVFTGFLGWIKPSCRQKLPSDFS